jgi:hypothetical protein
MALQPFIDTWLLFSLLILYAASSTPGSADRPVARPLPTQNKRTQTSMPQVRFEPTTAVFELAKTVHALDCAAAVIGFFISLAREKSGY